MPLRNFWKISYPYMILVCNLHCRLVGRATLGVRKYSISRNRQSLFNKTYRFDKLLMFEIILWRDVIDVKTPKSFKLKS